MAAPQSSTPWLRSRIGRASAADPLGEGVQRMGTLYSIIAVTFAVTIVLRAAAVHWSPTPVPGVWLGNAFALFAIASATTMAWITRRSRLPPSTILGLGLALEVFLCLALSLVEQSMVPADRMPPRLPYATVFILVFPIVVPASLGRRALTTFLCASTTPLATIILWAADLTAVKPVLAAFGWAVSYLVGGIAFAASRVVHRLAEDAQKARHLGSYQLERKIGSGGMGEVWEASHQMLARPAAIKLIRSKTLGADAEQARRRFEREAQATSALRSPHTVQLYDFGITPDGTLYYAMELLIGLDLEQLVKRFGPVPAHRAVHILRQICRSLAEAHEAGLLHRDIKPANVILCRLGAELDHVKVLDFGLVRAQIAGGDDKLSAEHVAIGTPAYMPPELAFGDADLDGRTDLYSLGCLGYWLLTGAVVFDEPSTMRMLLAHVQKTPSAPSASSELPIPEELDALLLACLEKDPADRPGSAEEVAARLSAVPLEQPWSDLLARKWWREHVPELARVGAAPRPDR